MRTPDLVTLELEADLVTCQPIDGRLATPPPIAA
jgi:hypothetical protein